MANKAKNIARRRYLRQEVETQSKIYDAKEIARLNRLAVRRTQFTSQLVASNRFRRDAAFITEVFNEREAQELL